LDLQTLCIVVILASVVTMLVRAIMSNGKSRSKSSKGRHKPPPGAFALDDALDKINETIRILQQLLGDRAPGRRNPDGGRFYIAYLVGVTREIARMNKVAYGPAVETPIRMELIRLGLDGTDSSEAMVRIMRSEEGQHGLAAGEMDGTEACHPEFKGEYFSRIQSYFVDSKVRGQR
jgi:hypothetical protein